MGWEWVIEGGGIVCGGEGFRHFQNGSKNDEIKEVYDICSRI